MSKDIHPRTPVANLRRDFSKTELERRFSVDLVAALAGMQPGFVAKVLSRRDGTTSLREVLALLDQDAFAETFVPRSKIPAFLLQYSATKSDVGFGRDEDRHRLVRGDAVDLIQKLPPRSVPCVVTSTPYWGMRIYDQSYARTWADGEVCALGNEQTPEGFIRHTIEILFALKRTLRMDGSVWWNLMDAYNTRTQIRANASETLNAMRGNDTKGWHDHECRRYSAGHSYLKDGEQCGIPGQVANRASRLGYFVRSTITWKKNGSLPETVETRVTRELEYIIHLTVDRSPRFNKKIFLRLPERLGGRNAEYEDEKITDVWHFATASGLDGHGAQYPVALPARCIALSTEKDDLVLDPFVGSGTTPVAATLLGRRSLGFDISERYLATARQRLRRAAAGPQWEDAPQPTMTYIRPATLFDDNAADGMADDEPEGKR